MARRPKALRRSPVEARFSVDDCFVCQEFKLVIATKGVTICRDCWPSTFAWVQMSQENKDKLMSRYDELEKSAIVRELLAKASRVG